jgi:hypothetical protein
MIVALLCWRCAEQFVEPVAIAGSVPLIHDYDVDPTSASIKTSGRCSEIGMRLDLNAHELTHGITRSRRSNLRACCSLHVATKSLRSR